jgi:uncharacterized protein (DUF1501 family)
LADAHWSAAGDPALIDLGARGSGALRARRHQALVVSPSGRPPGGTGADALRARVHGAIGGFRGASTIASSSIERDLRRVAALVAAGFSTRVYYARMGGFDTHAAQSGVRARLLGALGDALGDALEAFDRDLRRIGRDRDVVTLLFSEFGRRLEENVSLGTDHGTAAPMLLVGSTLLPGLHGSPAALDDLDENGNIAPTTDFRRVYAAIATGWFGIADPAPLGCGPFEPLPILV